MFKLVRSKPATIMQRKGVAPEIAVVILTAISVAATGTFYIAVNDLVDKNTEKTSEEIKLSTGLENIEVQSFLENGNNYKVVVSNNGENANNLSFSQLGKELNSTIIRSGETKEIGLGCLKTGSDTIELSSGISSDNIVIRGNNGTIGVPEAYCIDIENSYVIDTSLRPYRIWTGKVYKNTIEETPYSNKEVQLTIDGDKELETTDADGFFKIRERWDTEYISPGSMWKKEINYKDKTKTVNFHLGRGKFQPPNRVRLDYEDGQSRVYETQEAFKERESDHLDLTYDVIPQKVTEDEIEFKIDMNIFAKTELVNDFENNPNAKLLYQIPIPEGDGWGGPYAEVKNLECESGPDMSCRSGETAVSLNSSLSGETLERNELPSESGDKYIPLDHQVEASQNSFIGGLNPNHYFHHGGSEHNNPDFEHKYYFNGNTKRMIYIPEGEKMTFYDNFSLKSLENSIKSQFNDNDLTANTTYKSRDQLVTSSLGWWVPPEVATNNVVYSLEENPEFNSDTGASSEIDNVMYEWNDVEIGMYNPNFTVTLKRHENDRSFMLPVNLGTMGLFPDSGGKALQVGERYGVYSSGMIRYPPYRQTGRFSFKTVIPGKDSSRRAVVYKITLPGPDDTWTSKNYVLNTGEHKIDNTYLLNSQSQWEIFETTDDGDNWLDPGEVFEGDFNVDNNYDKKVKVNLQYQTISRSSKPDYSEWPYEFRMNVRGDQEYNFDISGDVKCNTRYCNSYRVGNSEEARPIDNLRGNDASKSLFDQDLSSIDFYLKNNIDNGNTAGQRVKLFKFWIWLMQPYSDNLKDQLVRPDSIKIKTLENDGSDQGILVKEY